MRRSIALPATASDSDWSDRTVFLARCRLATTRTALRFLCRKGLESNLVGGNQKFPRPLNELTRGQSITDACIDWATTEALLLETHSLLG